MRHVRPLGSRLNRKLVWLWFCALTFVALLVGKSFAGDDASSVLFDAKSLDMTELKASSMETLVNQKTRKVIEGFMISPKLYRAHASVVVKKVEKAEAPKKDGDKKPEDADPGSLLSVGDLINRAELERLRDEQKILTDGEGRYDYVVESVQVTVSFSEKVPSALRSEVEKAVQSDVGASYGEKFKLNLKSAADLEESEPAGGAIDSLAKLQFLFVAIIFAMAVVGALLVFKLVPMRQGADPFRAAIQLNQENAAALAAQSAAGARNYGDLNAPDAGPSVAKAAPNAESMTYAQLRDLEKKIAQIVDKNASLKERALLDWVASEDFGGVVVFLEALANEGVSAAKADFRPEVLEAIRENGVAVAQLSLAERGALLQRVYWTLVSHSFLVEDKVSEQFQFLEELDDASLLELLNAESPDIQSSILLALSEKRAARALSAMDSQMRENLVRELFSTPPLDETQLKEIASRVRGQAETVRAGRPKYVRMTDGIESLVPILETMDFQTQFTTAQSFNFLTPELRKQLQRVYFNVALLPDATDAFLTNLFGQREAQWTHAVLTVLGPEFRARVLPLLPNLQMRMIEDQAQNPVSSTYAWNALSELNQEILGMLNRGELSTDQVYPDDTLSAGTAEAAPTAEAVSPEAQAA